MITTQEELRALIRKAKTCEAVALDTEFVWERTYYPRLGLIQLAINAEECFLIDPCLLTDLSPLGELLADPAVVKILHDAPQDLTILYQATGTYPHTVFDSRLAAGFAGLSATLSLGNLAKELLNIVLPKTETRTNWLKRPLDPKQVEYALDDVRYLPELRRVILARIDNPVVLRWLNEELARFNNPAFYQPPGDETRYLKIKGAGNFSRQNLAVLRELAQWREQEARKGNRPRGHIIHDHALLSLATLQPQTIETMHRCQELPPKTIQRYGQQCLSLIKQGASLPETEQPPSLISSKLNPTEKTRLHELQEKMASTGKGLGIDPGIICNTAELKNLIRFQQQPENSLPSKLSNGWRQEFLAEIV